jgi:hypothetical protein
MKLNKQSHFGAQSDGRAFYVPHASRATDILDRYWQFVRRSAGVFSPHRRAKTNYPTTVGFGSAPGTFE